MQKINNDKKEDATNSLKEFLKKWPKFYYFVFDFFSPVYFGGVSPKKFLKEFADEGACYNLGSGARRISPDVVNVDVTEYPEVDIVGDITNLPIKDNEASSVICDQVLEHVIEPDVAVKEIYRVLNPGGYAYISTPYMYPFHASPSDYRRWTHVGYKEILSDFEIVDVGVRCGPFSTITVYLSYLLATMFSFGNEKLYWGLIYVFGALLFPIKILDIFGNRMPFSVNMAAVLYVVVKKPE